MTDQTRGDYSQDLKSGSLGSDQALTEGSSDGNKENLLKSPNRFIQRQDLSSYKDKSQSEVVQLILQDSALHDSFIAVNLIDKAQQENQPDQPDTSTHFRKPSLADSENNMEEMYEEEVDIRRKINQKLIRNKNYFMDFMGRPLKHKQTNVTNLDQAQQQMLQLVDKRSRSETPDKMSAGEVLLRAHQKLAAQAQAKQNESPHKLLEKHQLRQKKAEELRSQIEQSKKNWYEKIRIRQQIAKERWHELLAERKAKLQDKLEQAEERRETEIQTLKNKAKQEIQRIEETNYIMKMTMNNMKLDLKSKMTETQERRNQIMEEYKRKKQQDRALKEEAAEKRRQELQKSTEHKFLTNQQKREQAEQRRNKMIEEKKRASYEAQKRTMVLQRKNDLGDKISDVMSFVNNSECIWEFLGNERDWQDLGGFNNPRNDNLLFELIQKDHIELEKLKLMRDAELLDKMIVITEDGHIYSNKEYIPLAMKKYQRKVDYYYTDSSDENLSDDSQERDGELMITPEKIRKQMGILTPQRKYTEEETKLVADSQLHVDVSDGSDKDSIPEEAIKDEPHYQESLLQVNEENILTDEVQNYMLYSSRLKMSMKRNILKKTLSEDLTWADFLKNENYAVQQQFLPTFKNVQTRSMRSTPDRKQEFSQESESNELNISINQSNSSSIIKSSSDKPQKKGKTKKGSHGTTNKISSGSNVSEKSRISSVVYPSRKKKNPKNNIVIQQQISTNENKATASINSSKKNAGSSGQSSTNSLAISNSFSETPINHGRKSIHIESDSARKKFVTRLHSSSVQEPSTTGISTLQQPPSNPHNMSLIEDPSLSQDKLGDQHPFGTSHTGSQMSQLIANTRPSMPQSKILPKKLTVNATKMLFPIREQKVLLKRPGKEGQFGKFKISVKMEDLMIQKAINSTNLSSNLTQNAHSLHDISMDEKNQSSKLASQLSQLEPVKEQSSGKKSQQSTPSQIKRRESLDESNSFSNISSNNTIIAQQQLEVNQGTPTQSTSRLLQIQREFREKHTNLVVKPEEQSSKKTVPSQMQQISENSLSPPTKKDARNLNNKTISETDLNNSSNLINPMPASGEISVSMNELGYKELLIKYLLIDNIQLIKTDDNQKTIALEGPDADKVIDYLEQNECAVRYCRLCDLIIAEHLTNESHCSLKAHKKTRDELGIKESEDLSFSVLSLISLPGDIEKELLKEKEKALKRKVKRIKAQMIAQAVSHESATYNPGKEYNSTNKKRFQILCIDLEKQVIPIINNYEALENTLKEIIKILDMRKTADLHLMRKLKYMPILIEICKRIQVCHKNEFKHLGRMLDYVIKIINIFCGLRENRNYMLSTNRMIALIELLNWCLNRPTQIFYAINFLPNLFDILTLHVKHRAPYDCQQMKEMFIEYLICSQITSKLKAKFSIINGPLDLTEMMAQVPLFLLKSAAFLEALTSILQMDAVVRPVYEKSTKIGEHVLFVIQNTEVFGIIPSITTILLSRNQPFKPSQGNQQVINSNKVLPQTLVSLTISAIKIVNNVMRMDYKAAHLMMNDFEIQEQLYHLFNYLLYYTIEHADKQEDCKELLHETLLLIGYYSLNNEQHQQLLCKGESTLLQKLCNLPFPYFCDKKLKEILFPTLIQASYKNERSLAIMDQEISIEMLVDFIQFNLKEELPRIMEEVDDYHSISSLGGAAAGIERRTRSPSQSSTSSQASMQIDIASGNSPFLPLYMRFPKDNWKDAIAFYSRVLY